MSLLASITNNPVLLESADIHTKLDERDQLTCVIADRTQTALFTKGQQVSISETTLGQLFSGFIERASPLNIVPDPFVHWNATGIDNTSIADRRTSNKTYTNQYAGNIVLDQYRNYLQAEGVLANFASQALTTQADWNTGQLSNVSAADFGDGDLELASSGGIVTQSYNAQADWASGGSASNIQENGDGSVQLIGATRNWDNGDKSGQTLYGNGSPTDSISGGQYRLSCTHSSETRSRLDFAGVWQNGTIEVDVGIGSDIPRTGFTWRTTGWGNADGGFAYALEFTSTQIEIRKGQNSSGGGSTSSLGIYTFSPKLSYGTYRLRLVMSGSSMVAYVNGVQRLSVTDSSYSSPGYIALRNRNGEPSVSVTDTFDNFGVLAATIGSWTSNSVSVNAVTTVASSIITWDTSASQGGTITVSTSTDGGASYQVCTNGGSIPNLGKGASGTGKSVIVLVQLSTTTTAVMPVIKNLFWNVTGGYQASGTRSTAPLGFDTMTRANQSGWGTATDTQTWTKTGTGTDAISGNAATITNTTGDVHERLGSTTSTDEDGSVRFQLSAATISAGKELRYTDANNFYRLAATTTALTLSKTVSGTPITLATAVVALSTGVWYRMRFRTTGSASVLLQGRVWADGTTEPTTWNVTATETGAVLTALVLYGSNVAAATVTTADKLSTTTGGTEVSNTTNGPASGTNIYVELVSQGGTPATSGSLPAPSGKGWIYDVTTLEGQNIIAGNWSALVTLSDSLSGFTGTTLIIRFSKRTSGGVYTTIGSLSLSNQSIPTTKTTFSFPSTPLSAKSFTTGDKLYIDLFLESGSVAWASDVISTYVSNSGTQGVASDFQITTPGYQASGAGAFTSGGYGLMANGTGTATFDSFRVTTYPDPSLSLTPVGRAGNTSLSWNALVPTNTSLGMDISLDGVNWIDMSGQNGGPIPGIYAQPDPTIDVFNADTSMGYTNTNQTGGMAATVTYDTANSRVSLVGGTNAVYLYGSLACADVDLFGDLDLSDGGGLVWRYVDSSNFYLLLLSDTSAATTSTTSYAGRALGGAIPFTNAAGAAGVASLYKITGVTQTQLAQSAISWTRGKHARFRVSMLGGLITISMDGTQLFTYTDSSPLGKGQIGFFNTGGVTGSRYSQLWIQPQGDDLTGQYLYTRQRLATTDTTVTPQVLDMTVTASDPNIGLGALIPQAAYTSTFVSANIADLAKKSDYGWLIDSSNRLIFRGRQAIPAPWILDYSDVVAKQIWSLKVEYSGDLYSNRQVLTGVKDVQTFTDPKVGDSHTQSFPLKFPLATPPTITLNNVLQSVGIKGIDVGKNFYWQPADQTVYQDTSGTVLTSSDALTISGQGTYATTVTRDNLAGQAAYAALAGGTGIVEAVTDVSALGLNIAAAQAYGDMLNARYGKIGRTVTFTTIKPGMAQGQLLSSFIAQRQMTNVSLLITSVDIAIRAIRVPATTRYVPRLLGTVPITTNVAQRYEYTVVATELANPQSWGKQLAAIVKG